MNGQLIEYHNPSPGERYGVIKEKRADGKVTVLTGWYGMSGGNGGGRTSDENSKNRFKITLRGSGIRRMEEWHRQKHFTLQIQWQTECVRGRSNSSRTLSLTN